MASKIKIAPKKAAEPSDEVTSLSADQGLADMIQLDVLTEQSLLRNLKVRYGRDEIYVRVAWMMTIMYRLTRETFW